MTAEEAREVDLLTYLRAREPEELVPLGGDVYCTRTHDSLKISNGKWMWWSRGFGGYTAVGYLVRVRGMDYREALSAVAGGTPLTPEPAASAPEKRIRLPERAPDNDRVIAYLQGRGIDPGLIRECIGRGLLYESLQHRSAVFVGKDGTGTPRYGAFRSTRGPRALGEVRGSDKRYAFRLTDGAGDTVHVFESAVDALSYETVCRMRGDPPGERNLLSLGGAAAGKRLPPALAGYLQGRPETERIVLHLDNDRAGREAAERIRAAAGDRYEVLDEPPPVGKDVNDWLLHLREHSLKRERERDDDGK